MEHADYPHEPGTLYQCLACETECSCRFDGDPSLLLFEYDDTEACIFCASEYSQLVHDLTEPGDA